MTKWLISAESYSDGKAEVRWYLKTSDIESDPEVKEILSNPKLTVTEKEKKVADRVDKMLDEQAEASDAVVQNTPHSRKNHVDGDEISVIVTNALERNKEELYNQMASYLTSLGLGEDIITALIEVIDKSDSFKKLLKDNNVEIDSTITDILEQYGNLTK